jgi:uncharacterized protein (DUF2267 family)
MTVENDELVSAIRQSAGIPTEYDADRAVRATLRTLGERISGGTGSLAAQLPTEYAGELPDIGKGDRFGTVEFCRRVAALTGTDEATARRRAGAVLAALKNTLTGHEFDHVATQLTNDYAELIGTGPVKH